MPMKYIMDIKGDEDSRRVYVTSGYNNQTDTANNDELINYSFTRKLQQNLIRNKHW